MTVEMEPARIKAVYMALVASMFDRGILPMGWARWTGEEFELIDLPDIWEIVGEELQAARGQAPGR